MTLLSAYADKPPSQCQQRLSEWRSKMGSAGLAIVNSLLDMIDIDEPEKNDTDEKRQEYCQDLLDDLKFVWGEWVSETVRFLLPT